MPDQIENWVNLEEIAKYLAVHKDTVRNWIKKGTIPHTRAGKQFKFKISEVDAWMEIGETTRKTAE